MKQSLLACLLLLILTSIDQQYAFGQNNSGQIKGIIIDEDQSPVAYASIALYRQKDSTLITGSTSDEEGRFSITAPYGTYYAEISFLSFKTKYIKGIGVNSKSVNLGSVTMKTDTKLMEEVVIEDERPQMELKLDKRVFNIAQNINNQGNNGAEILDNIPSVTIDVDGNVSLRGSENVRILVNGRPSGLVGISPADALRQLQGNLIESVEIITNPSARYDAEGEVGIINIILKKEKRNGINGSFDVSIGQPDNYSAAYNLNYRHKKVNVFTSYGFGYRKTPGRGFSYQEFFLEDSTYAYERIRNHERGGLSNNLRFGVDYFLNKKNTITTSGMLSYSNSDNEANLIYNDLDALNLVTQTVTRTDSETETKGNIEVEINHEKTYDQKDRKWINNFKFRQSDDTEKSNIVEENSEQNIDKLLQRSNNTEDEVNWFFQSDYIHPISEEGKFEVGTKATLREINNDFLVEEQDSTSTWQAIDGFDNSLIYTENIYAAYIMLGNKINKFSYQGGVRAEYSDIKTKLVDSGKENPREFFSLFPSLHFSYELQKENYVQISYSRRVSRPWFRALLPFSSYSDPRNLYTGNPDLNPEFTNSFEMGYLNHFKKGSLLSSAYYRYTDNAMERITITDGEGNTLRFPVNLSVENSFGLEFALSLDLVKWWTINSNFNFFRTITDGQYDSTSYFRDTYSWNSRFDSKIKIKNKINLQTTLNYRAPMKNTQGKTLGRYVINLGISKDIFKGKGTATLSVRDLMNSRIWRSEQLTDTFNSENEFQWRSRQVLLSLNYRLNQNNRRSGNRRDRNYSGSDFEGGM